jgi:hypothetical protein
MLGRSNLGGEYTGSSPSKGKGRDLGYALAADSCERANSVESCTITALDVSTAFAVPDPSRVLADQPVFSGQAAHRVTSTNGLLSLLRVD